MCTHHACLSRRRFLIAGAAAGLLAACGSGNQGGGKTITPLEIDGSSSCALDGMLLADYPGPKAQIHYAGQKAPDFVCNTADMFYIHLAPEQVRKVSAIFVQDMAKADWNDPRGHWIDARSAWYVVGSSRHGSMGPTLASFAVEADAQRFAQQYGGEVHPYAKITMEMVTPPDHGLAGHKH